MKKRSKNKANKERLTIMIFKKVGSVKTFKISLHLIVWAALFFLFYILATIYMVNKYFDVSRSNKAQIKKIAHLQAELAGTQKGLERSRQHIALLGDYIKEKEGEEPRPLSPLDYAESSLPRLVDINELTVKRDASTIDVDFRIVNMQPEDEPVGGYIFILARVKDSDKPEVWVYPSTPLRNGLPVNYRKGQRFLIQRFKSVSSKYTIDKSLNRTIVLEILVYDRDGRLILKKIAEA